MSSETETHGRRSPPLPQMPRCPLPLLPLHMSSKDKEENLINGSSRIVDTFTVRMILRICEEMLRQILDEFHSKLQTCVLTEFCVKISERRQRASDGGACSLQPLQPVGSAPQPAARASLERSAGRRTRAIDSAAPAAPAPLRPARSRSSPPPLSAGLPRRPASARTSTSPRPALSASSRSHGPGRPHRPCPLASRAAPLRPPPAPSTSFRRSHESAGAQDGHSGASPCGRALLYCVLIQRPQPSRGGHRRRLVSSVQQSSRCRSSYFTCPSAPHCRPGGPADRDDRQSPSSAPDQDAPITDAGL
ncbi:hypothetical protein ZWY2020_051548 [Hordeum vulgare]|nr:hypothetical protein ZWY2020_051548 [Hordeum vulgare]